MIYFIIPILAAVVLYFLVFKKNAPKRLADQPQWHEPLLKYVSFYENLNHQEQKVFRQRMSAFLNETYVEAVGFELEELDKLLVAASAVIPVFRFKEWSYNNLSGVIIYPENFNENLGYADHHSDRMIGGLVGTGRFEKQMILSRTVSPSQPWISGWR
jgi:Mlc titration factor MtfA (ptsG expression regulator)